MDYADERDETLMSRVANGQPGPLTVLLRRHAQPLFTFLRRMSGSEHVAEELFQEVFLAVWTHRDRYADAWPFRPWLFGIARNKCLAQRRLESRANAALWTMSEGQLRSRDPAPADVAISAETATLVQNAVLKLSQPQRAVLVLRVWNELSYAEIAAILERNEATVRSTMFHALAALRKHLKPTLH